MKQFAKIVLAVMLASMTALPVVSCGNNVATESNSSSSSSASSDITQESGSEVQSTDSDKSTDGTAEYNEDPCEITMLLVSDGNSVDKDAEVEDAVNAILSEKLNTTVSFTMVSSADHTQKVNLMLASGDPLDLFQPYASWNNFMANSYMMDITDYADYYPDIIELCGDYLASGQYNGRQYGLPSVKDWASDSCYVFRTDILEACDIDASSIMTPDDIHDMLVKIKSNYPDLVPMMGGSVGAPIKWNGDLDKNCSYDPLGDGYGVLMNPAESTTVENFYETESFARQVQYAWEWAQEGLIDRDNLTLPHDLVRAGRTAGVLTAYSPKSVAETTTSTGYDMTAIRIFPKGNALLTTNNSWSWCVNSICENPERALQMLNYMFTDKEINNLLAWGIEGEDYQVISDEGSGVIDYVEGQDSGTVEYYQWAKFSFPNNFLQYVMNGTNPHQWEEMEAWNESADASLALGFSYDNTAVSTQVAAVSNVVNEYYDALLTGQLDPETELPNFIAALKSAGIDEIVAEKQSQLDIWLEAKG